MLKKTLIFLFRRNTVLASLKTLTTKHMAYFSSLYFSFMLRLVRINANAVKESIEFVRETIANVEQMRGAGRDGKLRYTTPEQKEIQWTEFLTQ